MRFRIQPPSWNKLMVFSLAIYLLSSLAMILVVLNYSYKVQLVSPVVEYEQTRYLPDRADYCPGETMYFTPTWIIRETPRVVEMIETWVFGLDPTMHVIPDNHTTYYINDVPGRNTRPVSVKIPQLPAGLYEYRRALFSDGTLPTVLSVPVQIRENCD